MCSGWLTRSPKSDVDADVDAGRRRSGADPKSIAAALAVLALLLGLLAWLVTGGARRERATPAGEVARAPSLPVTPSEFELDPTARSAVPLTTAEAASNVAPRPDEAASELRGTLRIRVSWAEDSRPAVGVPVRIIPVGVADSRLNEREGVTDTGGELLVEGLRPGPYAPETCFGGSVAASVEAERECVASIAIPSGAAVRGLVVDELDRPVASAEIWLTYGSFRLIGAVVAVAGADGRFALRSVECTAARYIGARGAGFAPSPSAVLVAEPGSTVEVRLELGLAGGAIRGRVVARSGDGLANALVVVGRDSARESRLSDGTRAAAPPPIRARTDANGEFHVACAPAELVPVLVRAHGFSPWWREVDVPAHGAVELSVVLEPGASLEGTVSGSDGAPVAGVEIRIGDWDDPAGSLVRSAVDGSFRLDSLAAGEFAVTATSHSSGKASAHLWAQPGEVVRWDPVLAPGGEIATRIIDDRDAPLAGWTVEVGATVEGEWLSRWGATGVDGRFVARNCPDAAYMLRVSEPGASFTALQFEGVRPGSAELVVRVPDELRALGSITGSLNDPDGAPVGGASVRASRANDAAARTRLTEAGTGRFGFERVPPGEYTLWIQAPGFPVLALGPHTLDAGESWELGDLHLEQPGALVLKLSRDDGAPVGRPGLHCRRIGSPVYDEPVPDRFGVARSAPLAAGNWVLYVYGEDVVSTTRAFEIAAGRETTLELVIRSGIHVRLVFLDPPARALPIDTLHFRMLDERGEAAAEVDLTRRPGTPFEWHVGIPAGAYRLEALGPEGLVHASVPLVLRNSPSQPRRIEIQLR